MKSLPYYDDLTARQTIKLRELIKTLPPFAKEFFRAIDSTTQVRTRIAYAYDLRVFFHFLIDENPAYRNYSAGSSPTPWPGRRSGSSIHSKSIRLPLSRP